MQTMFTALLSIKPLKVTYPVGFTTMTKKTSCLYEILLAVHITFPGVKLLVWSLLLSGGTTFGFILPSCRIHHFHLYAICRILKMKWKQNRIFNMRGTPDVWSYSSPRNVWYCTFSLSQPLLKRISLTFALTSKQISPISQQERALLH